MKDDQQCDVDERRPLYLVNNAMYMKDGVYVL